MSADPQKVLQKLRDFRAFAAQYWLVHSKSEGYVDFELQPGQRIANDAIERQWSERGFVRLNVLKCRQVGFTTLSMAMGLHYVMTHSGATALTIGHESGMPQSWLRKARAWYRQTPNYMRPSAESTSANELRFGTGARYYIGSAQSGFPGVGDTVHFLHLSELGRWDKPPISVDPKTVLQPLNPAIPRGAARANTVIIRESTGVMIGDYWHRMWEAGKSEDDDFENIFLPWFLVPDYRRDDLADDVLARTQYEKSIVDYGRSLGVEVDNAQLAWRRHELRQSDWIGNEEAWASEYPAFEHEAFQLPGGTIYDKSIIKQAENTIRKPIWRGEILPGSSPMDYKFADSESGRMEMWEEPDERFSYVVGADCQWGKSVSADFDVAYVECLETAKLCAKVKGQMSLYEWGMLLASLGFYYNIACLAPERNAQAAAAADGLMPMLLGNTGDWRYPNLYVRTDDLGFRGHRPKDYGWWTDHRTKGELIQYSLAQTVNEKFDWCDAEAVGQMATIVRHEDNTVAAPKGSHDDCWMARLITGYVAHRQRTRTVLWEDEKEKPKIKWPSLKDRLRRLWGDNDEDEEE